MTVNPTDIIGQHFNQLTVLSYVGYLPVKIIKKHIYNIECTCGVKKQMSRQSIFSSVSCGCKNKEVISIANTSRSDQSGRLVWEQLYKSHKKVAEDRGIATSITFEEFKIICSQNCYYCDTPPPLKRLKNYSATINWNGIDRIDNDVGYTLSNSRPCCTCCNRMKLDNTEGEFFKKIELIYKKHLNHE